MQAGQPVGALPEPAHLIDEPIRDQLAAVQFRVVIAIGVFRGLREPADRNSPSCASSSSRSAAATIWCTREEESLTAAVSARMDTGLEQQRNGQWR